MKENAERLCRRLWALGWHISFAESCTGGLAAATLVGVSGASDVFDGGFVTYANSAKVRFLGVDPSAIAAEGVVSETVAGQMAVGCANTMGAEVGIGISGIAGPGGGTAEKPVGTVCFGFFVNGKTGTETLHFTGMNRLCVRRAAVAHIFTRLLTLLPQVPTTR